MKDLPIGATQSVFSVRKKGYIIAMKGGHRQTFAFLANYQDLARRHGETGDIFHLDRPQGMPHQYQVAA